MPDTTLLPAPSASLTTKPSPRGDPSSSVRAITGPPSGRNVGSVIGQPVANKNGEPLGTIQDVLIDVYSSRIEYVAVAAPPDHALRLISFAGLHRENERDGLKAEIDSAQWEQISRIDARDFESGRITLTPAEHRDLVQRFGQRESAWLASPSPESASATSGSQLVRLSRLRGKQVSTGGEEVGVIDDVIVDENRVTGAAVVSPTKDFAVANRRFVVPLQHLNLASRENNPILTTLTRPDFESALR